jgi:6-phosphofructokinase 1
MNAAVRAVVRRTLARGHEVTAIHEGYAGLLRGAEALATMHWSDVSRILQLGGTVLGTARSADFREPDGRRRATATLVQAGIDRLVVIGGDGSLTGADTLRSEWTAHLEALVADGAITKEQAERHPALGLAGLVGSIDNDLWGTDRTIGCDSALHRIVDAVDTLTSTARSHQRSFVVQVMGRRAGFLALAAAVCTGADHVVIPERPALDWEGEVCAALRRGKALGNRQSIVLLAEGARDRDGRAITAEAMRTVVEAEVGIETRTTVLGHVQRGGTPSAYDRVASTALGAAAADAVLDREPTSEPVVLTTAGPRVEPRLLATAIRRTHAIATALDEGRYQAAVNARGTEFVELLSAYDALQLPARHASVRRRLLLAHVGAPAPGMNAAIRAFVRLTRVAGHVPILASEGLRGLLAGQHEVLDGDADDERRVRGITGIGATVLGTNRWIPTDPRDGARLEALLDDLHVDGVVLVGGFEALVAAGRLGRPVAVVPATISNNVPATEQSIGADTAVNAICEAVDRLKQSAIGSRNRVFFVEVMGRRCGYLARAAGVAAGAELVYTDEDPLTLARLQADVHDLNAAMDAGRTVGIALVADGVPRAFRASRLAELFHETSGGRFDTRVCVLGHLQQGGRPSPADRLLATRLVQTATSTVLAGQGPVVVGVRNGDVVLTPLDEALARADADARRPTRPRQLLPDLTS